MNLHGVKSRSIARARPGTAVILAVLGLATGCASRDAGPARAQADSEERGVSWSPAAQALQSWLVAYNAGNLDSARAFADKHFAPLALAQRHAGARAESDVWMYLNLGGMELIGLDSVSDTSAIATVKQKLVDGWGHVIVRVASAVPHPLLSREITFFERAPAGRAPARPVTDAMLARNIDAYARRLTEADVFSGVVLIARDRHVILGRAYGDARRSPPVPNTLDTRFQVASVSKMFTAVAIAQLVEEGKLSFEDTLSQLLPEYPNHDAARRITIAQLLTHTAGLPEYFASPHYPELRERLRAPSDYWPLFAADSLRFAPGSQWEYSNSNYVVLGAIIQRVTGRPFRDHIADRVFRPAGMSATSYAEGAFAGRPDVAVGYTRSGPNGRDLTNFHEVAVPPGQIAGSAGGGLSTASDLLRFGNALLENRLVSLAMMKQLFAAKVPTEDGQRAFGFEWHEWNGVRWVGHNGFAPGAFDQVDIYPDQRYTVVVLSNNDMSGAGAIAYRLRLLLTAR